MIRKFIYLSAILFLFFSCSEKNQNMPAVSQKNVESAIDFYDFNKKPESQMDSLVSKYTPFKLESDLSALTPNEKKMIPLLIDAAKIMDNLFWEQAFGTKDYFLNQLEDKTEKAFALINYGPWDRLNGNKSFLENYSKKPLGANFYPADMIKEELEQTILDGKESLYTMIRRNQEDGSLYTIPYNQYFKNALSRAAFLLEQASSLADDKGLKKYLELRSKALLNDKYQESDMAWLDMKSNKIDIVIGPIETYEDQLFGYKAAYEAYVLIKDMDWSKKLSKYAGFLPELQNGLPVDDKYKAESPGTDTELNAYDVVYYAGDCNAGSKTIAINLPNDEVVQLEKGTRRLQLKNAMKAKFDKILLPIANELIDDSQRHFISFDAFFANTMFHEVAHGLGIKNTLNGSGTVRKALKEHASAIEEGKADILGIYMVNQLHKKGEIDGNIDDYIVTFMTSIFRSIRFGASSAHGKANMIRFNYFAKMNAFTKDKETGKYKINFDNFQKAVDALSNEILTIQGDGDYKRASELVENMAVIDENLQKELDELQLKGIPVDVIFDQGKHTLGL